MSIGPDLAQRTPDLPHKILTFSGDREALDSTILHRLLMQGFRTGLILSA
jgi:hypothetical protein